MELVLQIQDRQTLAIALEHKIGIAVSLPQDTDDLMWSELMEWRTVALERGFKFYLIWDQLLKEEDLVWAEAKLAAVARINPDGVQLRDLGLIHETHRLYPHLKLIAAENWGARNSPGVRLAESLGFSRVVIEGPISLKNLALIRRQSNMPLMVTLPDACRGYASLCLMAEYLGVTCETCCLAKPMNDETIMAALETFSGLCQLGVEVVQIRGEMFLPTYLGQVIEIFRSVAEAPPMERPRVMAAARQVVEAFGNSLLRIPSSTLPTYRPSALNPFPPSHRNAEKNFRSQLLARGRVWLETRDYAEATELSREWREPLVLELTPNNYGPFLQVHRHWDPRRLIWRLPSAIPESSLAFYPKALDTIGQGGYDRVIAGDWGAVALALAAGIQVFGDQTLGVRNSWSMRTLRKFKLTKICLPPGNHADHWRKFLAANPPNRFWSYLYQSMVLAVCPEEAATLTPPEDLRWFIEDGKACLCLKTPQTLLGLEFWFRQHSVFPLVVALPHSPCPRNKIPSWLSPRTKPHPLAK